MVDVDDVAVIKDVVKHFGPTPLITRTPSGGGHFWYRRVRTTPSRNLRRVGLAVDVKADGGYVVVPPSVNMTTGVPYCFDIGGWGDLSNLPSFRNEALDVLCGSDDKHAVHEALVDRVPTGERNETLFRHLVRAARGVSSLDELLAEARRFNADCVASPMSDGEIAKTAGSVWNYKQAGRLWSGSRGRVIWSLEDIERLASDPAGGDAMVLISFLQTQHAARDEPFAVAARAMARDQCLPGWSEHRYRAALKAALKSGLIECLKAGGRGVGDAAQFRLKKLV